VGEAPLSRRLDATGTLRLKEADQTGSFEDEIDLRPPVPVLTQRLPWRYLRNAHGELATAGNIATDERLEVD
jgi:hypothetical protein